MSRMEPDEDLRKRYAAMEDRLGVSRSCEYLLACSWSATSFDQLKPSLAAAGCPETSQQAHDFGREGELQCLVLCVSC